jgi:antitoxin CptB
MVHSREELSRLRWRCRRGMRELDVLLMAYLEDAFVAAPAEEQAAFERLLSLQDPDIHALLTGRLRSDDSQLRHVVQRLLQHS